jgi:hypothetical protein
MGAIICITTMKNDPLNSSWYNAQTTKDNRRCPFRYIINHLDITPATLIAMSLARLCVRVHNILLQTLSHATPQQTVPRHLLSITPRQLSFETLIRRCSLTIGDFTLVEIPRIAHITAHAKERCPHAWIQLANRFSQQCNDLCTRAPTIIVSYEVGSVHSVTVKDTLSYPRRLHPTACGPPTPSSPFKQSAVHVLTLCHLRPKQTNYCASSISNNLTSGRYELTTCFTL